MPPVISEKQSIIIDVYKKINMNPLLKQASLKLVRVTNSSRASEERVLLKVTEAGHVKGYAIVDSTFTSDEEPSNEFRHIFLFPQIEVALGDYIQVFTGIDTYGSHHNRADTVTHKLYWNSEQCVWNDKEGDTAVLINFNVVSSVSVPAKEPRNMKFKRKG
jgi:hypothetical protein